MRDTRNADERWRAALRWADEQVGEPKQCRRKAGETDEAYAERCAKGRRDTRRDIYRKELYAGRRIYWGTWNGLIKAVEQARKAVIQQRAKGLPAEWNRPKFSDPCTLYADPGGFRVVERDGIWWTFEMRLGVADDWVRFKAKCGNWHDVPDDAKLVCAKLTRRKDGERWAHSVSVTIDTQKPRREVANDGLVSLDWGHREHGHENERDGMRVFTWLGDDGASGEVLLPPTVREHLDRIDELKSRIDTTFDARKKSMGIPEKNRYTYRRRLMQAGVRSEDESLWLKWEMRQERRIMHSRKKVTNIRSEVYRQAVHSLRAKYLHFVFEDEKNWSLKKQQKEEQMIRRKRANRDVSARYEFVQLCERFGADIITVPSRNTTRECPSCGHLDENTAELLVACSGCGIVRDKDQGAAVVILRRGQEALAKRNAA